jgi:hypothetical protein
MRNGVVTFELYVPELATDIPRIKDFLAKYQAEPRQEVQ